MLNRYFIYIIFIYLSAILKTLYDRIKCYILKPDPNFDAHLPDLLKVGIAGDRPEPDIAAQLRAEMSARFSKIEGK